jgi:shikimate dehydrogenase
MRRVCVIGWPVGQSLSPVLHGFWLREHGIEGEYTAAAIPPEEFAGFVQAMPERGFVGANVTVPHKLEAFRLCAHVDTAAAAIGAANTLWFEDGVLHGTNTDGAGFVGNLDSEVPGWDAVRDAPAVIIGAGGSARAIIWVLRERGFSVFRILNRTMASAENVAQLVPGRAEVFPLDDLPRALENAGFVVNTSTLGMAGAPPLDIDFAPVRADAVAADIVYKPLETGFLKAAKARGLRTADGIGMLLHQAVPGFRKWFGVSPTVTPALRAEVIAARLRQDEADAS